jgi:hypothetical protein
MTNHKRPLKIQRPQSAQWDRSYLYMRKSQDLTFPRGMGGVSFSFASFYMSSEYDLAMSEFRKMSSWPPRHVAAGKWFFNTPKPIMRAFGKHCGACIRTSGPLAQGQRR